MKENYELVEWRLNDELGEVITDDNSIFTGSATVFAVSKEVITITVKGDAGIELAPENTFTADKNTKWGEIKTTAEAKMSVKENYEFVEWRLDSGTGEVLTDDKAFEQNTTVFAVSKKQQVTITVQGDAGIAVVPENTFTADKNATWGEIKTAAEAKMSVKANYRFVEWRLNSGTGEVLNDDKAFEQNTTVFAVSKETVTITVKGDAGVDIAAENTFTVDKNTKWGDIKTTAEAKMSVKANYRFVEWRLNSGTGEVLNDDKRLEQNATVFAVSKETITITVKGDAGIEIPAENTFTADKNAKWGDIKNEAEDKISVKANYRFVEWRLNSGTGEVLNDDKAFEQNATVYAVSKETVTITVQGDERIDLQQTIEKPYDTAWSSVKAEIEGNIKPSADWKDDWNNGDYELYEWRLGGENGEKIGDDYHFTENVTVYAVSNYKKWEIEDRGSGNKVLSGVDGSKPRGKIILPDDVTSIGGFAFDSCSSLTGITIPASVKSIERDAFNGCSSLTGITISNGVESIERYAFASCSSLTGINIPASVTSIGEGAFGNCKTLTLLIVDSGNTNYKSDKNIIYTKDGKTLIAVASGLSGTIDIPDGVISIGDDAFIGCSAISTVTIPESVTSIESEAFFGCTGLTSINIPASVKSIGKYAFSTCSSLTHITIANGVESIGWNAFDSCSSLTGITIPASVKSIGWQAFAWCSSLTGINIPNGVTSIGKEAFIGCTRLASITISEGVKSIGGSAFKKCTDLTSITIPASVTEIGPSVFDGCRRLDSVTFTDPEGWKDYYNNPVDVSTSEKAIEALKLSNIHK